MLEFKYDTQLLIEGKNLNEDEISEYFTTHFKGDCLLAVGDDELIKIHFHTNEPWKVLEYCSTLGEVYDIVIEDMDRQSRGLKGWLIYLIHYQETFLIYLIQLIVLLSVNVFVFFMSILRMMHPLHL